MTCFWDAILSKLPRNVIHKYLDVCNGHKQFIDLLKERAKSVNITDVTWNDTQLSTKEVAEYIEWISQYDTSGINAGHDTSVCDPFLVLICHIFMYDIDHDYNGTLIRYRNTNNRDAQRCLFFASDRGHMW